jgi:hypothetical protein
VDALGASDYPAVRRVHAAFNWLVAAQALPPTDPLRADVAEREARFWDLFAAAARERTLATDEELVGIAARWQVYRVGQRRPRDVGLADLDRHLRRAGGREYLRLTVRGAGLINVAWDARGTGLADTVPERAWEVFHARLGDAREVLADAAEADPTGFSAPTEMLTVCMGLSIDRAEMEYTFRQAMAANPLNRMACRRKLEILHPKWQGSPDGTDYMTFAWALALQPGASGLGMAGLDNVIGNMPAFGPRFEANRHAVTLYYSHPDVWGLVRTACERAMEATPGDDFALNLYARISAIALRPEVARDLYGRIGANFSPRVFADRAEYERFRSMVVGPPR